MAKYKIGTTVNGVVTGIEKYGIFIGLDEFYSGLIHISEISNDFVKDINEYVQVGETISAKVIDVDDENNHVKLSIKGIEYKPNKKKRQKIVETEKGFTPLKDNIDDWIEQKMNEINRNSYYSAIKDEKN